MKLSKFDDNSLHLVWPWHIIHVLINDYLLSIHDVKGLNIQKWTKWANEHEQYLSEANKQLCL